MSESEDVSITQGLIKEWLKEKHCTLWQDWDIVSSDGIERASKWMMEQIASIANFAQAHHD